MSNIFYSEVDPVLQQELNRRGDSGRTRSTEDINFMVGKIANVQLTAYAENNSDQQKVVGILGGTDVRTGRFLPNTFLTKQPYSTTSIEFSDNGNAYIQQTDLLDESYRIGPYITSVDISIGDHSMGLLNKATVNISIPNPQRDLDRIEETWFRPGRYTKIEIAHPETAVLSKSLLSTTSIPTKNKLKELYPNWNIDDLEKRIRKMNEYSFEGLITSFDFSYQTNGQVDATLSLTGTSNVYTDISMWMPTPTKTEESKKPKIITDPVIGVVNIPTTPNTTTTQNTQTATKNEFYDKLSTQVTSLINDVRYNGNVEVISSGIIKFKTDVPSTAITTDRYILFGEPYKQLTTSTSLSTTKFNRYITLGALAQFLNDEVISKITGTAQSAEILCDTEFSCCNYYPLMTSCIPDDVLLLPQNTDTPNGMNVYGSTLTYYKNISSIQTSNATKLEQWPGVHTNSDAITTDKVYASRIFVNLETIQKILNGEDGKSGLTAGGTRSFSVKTFLATISSKISYATGAGILLKLVTHPLDETKLLFTDVNYLKTPLLGAPEKPVTPYDIPMFANHPSGTIVRDFKLSATLPENAKNLSYVLNQGDEVTEDQIAPYMNIMYNSKDEDAINKITQQYKNKHVEISTQLRNTRSDFGLSPTVPEKSQALWKALSSYIKYPTDDIRKSQQISAPIFPFSAEFTIDGINGFRYGDVLQFSALPKKYRVNTVFSIISITHTVGTDGQWTTVIRCIMRPSID